MNYFDLDSVGSKLKYFRQIHNLSMRQLASKANVAASFISKIESGKTSPTIMTLQKILEAMDVPVVDFFTNNQNSPAAEQIVFRHHSMKALQGQDRKWMFTFPSDPDIHMTLTYEEYYPESEGQECEQHDYDIAGFIIDGEMSLRVLEYGDYKIYKGDAFYIKAGMKHIVSNQNTKTVKLVAVKINE